MRSEQVTIDCLQYCNWSPTIFDQMAQGGVDAVHVTICYHEDFGETVQNFQVENFTLCKSLKNGAEEKTRTSTHLRVHEPESCASTNSATSAP